MTTTETPRTDACPHCGAEHWLVTGIEAKMWKCTSSERRQSDLCKEKQARQKAESEVERLREQLESTKLLAVKFWKVLEENGFKIELPK